MRELAIAFGGDGLSPERLLIHRKKAASFIRTTKIPIRHWGRYMGGQAIRFFNNLETI